jgi:dihydropyrimidine dehydrogenase (NAD+) subunit PreT
MELEGVWTAAEYLKKARVTNGKFNSGNKVVIIGGGDVAMDCAATAKLAGAEKVMIYYRRTVEEAPAYIEEIKFVQSLGVTMTTEFAPKEILADGNKVGFVVFEGRDKESEAKIKADTVVFAVGQEPEAMHGMTAFKVNDKGFIVVGDETGETGIDGVFAAGDIVNGGKTVVEAVAEGKKVAIAMVYYLEKKEGVK